MTQPTFKIFKRTYSYGERYFIKRIDDNILIYSFTPIFDTLEEAREHKKYLEQIYEEPSDETEVE